MRRTFFLLTLILLLTPVAAWSDPLRMGVLPVLDVLPLYVAQEEGLFAKEGVELEFVPFMSALERDTAMQSGQLDGYFGDLINTLLLIKGGAPIRIVTVSYETTPGQRMFALMLGPGQELGAELSVGISRSTIIEYVLDGMSRSPALAGIQQDRAEVKKIPIRMQMLLGGQLQSALLPEPLVSLTESKGARAVVTDEELDMPLTVLCLSDDWMDKREQFIEAYWEALELMREHPEKYVGLMVEACRIPEHLTGKFAGYRFPDPHLPSEDQLFRVQQWMLARSMLTRLLPYNSLIAH